MTEHTTPGVGSSDPSRVPANTPPPAPAAQGVAPIRREPSAEDFTAMRNSAEFKELKKTYRSFTFPLSVAFFVWFLAYVLTATYAPEFMVRPMWGMNVGIYFGLAQFLTTFIITWLYVTYANKNIEPQAAAIRAKMED